MNKNKENLGKCEVCGKDDLESVVTSSNLGAVSFRYCEACLAMGAEPKSLVDEYDTNRNFVTYNPDTDSYYLKGKEVSIELKNGKKLRTRGEYVNFKKNQKFKGEKK